MRIRRFVTPILVLSLSIFAGCRDREITTYRAPKDTPPTLPPAASGNLPADHPPIGNASSGTGSNMANTPVPTANGNDLIWTAPVHWTPKALGAMRKGSFAIKGDGADADLSITAFPGSTGGLEANLNRWRGQVGLTPASAEEVTAAAEKIDANGLQFTVVDYAGNNNRLLGAVVAYGGNSWFFKLLGPDALVAAQKNPFLDFLRTVRPAQP
jgi:hypothetical protein